MSEPRYRNIPPLTYEEWDLVMLAIGAGLGAISQEMPWLIRDMMLVLNKIGSRSPDYQPYDPDKFTQRMKRQ